MWIAVKPIHAIREGYGPADGHEWSEQADTTRARLVPVVVTGERATSPVVVHAPGGISIEVSDAMLVPAQWVAAVVRELSRS